MSKTKIDMDMPFAEFAEKHLKTDKTSNSDSATGYTSGVNLSEKVHQANRSEYQIRVDGKPVYFNGCISKHTFDKYRELCHEKPDCYVDIVRVSTDIICDQSTYHKFKRHFEAV